jgi:CubicO group peptidase (beta-lactamase class C family)
MKDTRVDLDDEQTARLARGRPQDDGPPNLDWPSDAAEAPAGALHSTALDMIRYLEAHIGMRSSPLDGAIATAVIPRRPTDEAGEQIGLFWQTGLGASGEIYKNGGTSGFAAFAVFNRDAKIGLVLLTNGGAADPDAIAAQLVPLVYE